MFANRKFRAAAMGLGCIVGTMMADGAFAISVELAKKCDALTAKAFPPRVIGNPAAGSAKGTGHQQQAYYRKCVANNGKMKTPSQ